MESDEYQEDSDAASLDADNTPILRGSGDGHDANSATQDTRGSDIFTIPRGIRVVRDSAHRSDERQPRMTSNYHAIPGEDYDAPKTMDGKGYLISCTVLILVSFACSVAMLSFGLPALWKLQNDYAKIPNFSPQLNNLTKDMKEMNASLVELTNEVGNVTSLEKRVADINSSVSVLETSIDKVGVSLKQLENESNDFNKTLQSEMSNIKNLTNILEEVKKQNSDLKKIIDENSHSITKLNQSIALTQKNMQRLNSSISQNSNALQDINDRLRKIEQEINNSAMKNSTCLSTLLIIVMIWRAFTAFVEPK